MCLRSNHPIFAQHNYAFDLAITDYDYDDDWINNSRIEVCAHDALQRNQTKTLIQEKLIARREIIAHMRIVLTLAGKWDDDEIAEMQVARLNLWLNQRILR